MDEDILFGYNDLHMFQVAWNEIDEKRKGTIPLSCVSFFNETKSKVYFETLPRIYGFKLTEIIQMKLLEGNNKHIKFSLCYCISDRLDTTAVSHYSGDINLTLQNCSNFIFMELYYFLDYSI